MSALLTFDILRSPLRFLEEALAELPLQETLRAGEAWWLREGKAISDAVDRAGTPWLQMFDRNGTRIDQPLFPPEYGRMLKRGYREGMVWRAFEERSEERGVGKECRSRWSPYH